MGKGAGASACKTAFMHLYTSANRPLLVLVHAPDHVRTPIGHSLGIAVEVRRHLLVQENVVVLRDVMMVVVPICKSAFRSKVEWDDKSSSRMSLRNDDIDIILGAV